MSGRAVDGAWFNINAGAAQLLAVQTSEQVCGRVPEVLALVRAYLPPEDPRRIAVERRFGTAHDLRSSDLAESDRHLLMVALHGAYFQEAVENGRVRRFRNVLLGTFLVLVMLVGGVVAAGMYWPQVVPLCFPSGEGLMCPTGPHRSATGGDVPLVALLGLVGAAFSAVRTLRVPLELPTRYSLTVPLVLLKVSMGAATAIFGLVALGLSALSEVNSQAALLFGAVLLGYGQQLLTGPLDRRVGGLLRSASPETAANAPDQRPMIT
ncbi:hypothetical protein GCM10010411_66900 [Actinomadura fulvescens]|uniref:Uncharacterized protein n=1 Tax=Actinomadura fulvescens TaxID=46160 RepID=A0ABP6CIY6_9ACTN